jgi:hypothetical protein
MSQFGVSQYSTEIASVIVEIYAILSRGAHDRHDTRLGNSNYAARHRRRSDRITMLFAALHESAYGPFRKWRDVRVESEMRTITDIRMSVGKLGSEYRWRYSPIGELSAATHD